MPEGDASHPTAHGAIGSSFFLPYRQRLSRSGTVLVFEGHTFWLCTGWLVIHILQDSTESPGLCRFGKLLLSVRLGPDVSLASDGMPWGVSPLARPSEGCSDETCCFVRGRASWCIRLSRSGQLLLLVQ